MKCDVRPLISVIIPVRNEGTRIVEAVSSIVAGRSRNFPLEIIVVDDASTDDSCAHLSTLFTWARDQVHIAVIGLGAWKGIPFARNAGAFRASAPTLFITDANVTFPANWDIPIAKHIGPRRVLCATITDCASSFRGYGGSLQLPSMVFRWLRSPAIYGRQIPVSPCSSTIISANLFRSLGGYDTGMPVYGAAEPEFSVRIWLSGAEVISVPELVLRHHFRPPAQMRTFMDNVKSVQVRNYLRFGLLYLERDSIMPLFQYYAETVPSVFENALDSVYRSDVWQRRSELSKALPHHFSWFSNKFNLQPS